MIKRFQIHSEPIGVRALLTFRFLIYLQLLILSIWGRQIFPAEYLTIENIEILYIPQSFFKLLNIPFPSAGFFVGATALYRMGLIICMTGLAFRAFSIATAILGLFIIGFPYQFGFEPHYISPHATILVLMCFMKLPSLLDYYKNKNLRSVKSLDYQFYTNCLKLLWISIFFTAGLEKIKESGLEYFFSAKHLNSIILSRAYFFDYNTFNTSIEFTRFLIEKLKIHYFFGLGLLFELLTPLVFFKIRKIHFIVFAVLLMQTMIYLLTELKHLWFYLPLYLIFIPDNWFEKDRNLN